MPPLINAHEPSNTGFLGLKVLGLRGLEFEW